MAVDWWANLFQGALSAMLGGAVAALTAWGVVTATGRQLRRQAARSNALSAAQGAIEEMQIFFASVQSTEPWKRRVSVSKRQQQLLVAGTRFLTRTTAHMATIAAIDREFAERMTELKNAIGEDMPHACDGRLGRWARRGRPSVLRQRTAFRPGNATVGQANRLSGAQVTSFVVRLPHRCLTANFQGHSVTAGLAIRVCKWTRSQSFLESADLGQLALRH